MAGDEKVKLNIIYNDDDVLVVYKPAFVSSQAERGSGMDMVSLIKNHYAKVYKKKVDVYVVHRLDKPVAGVMVYALNKKAAASLSEQIREGEMNKRYYAIIKGMPDNCDKLNEWYELTDMLASDGRNNITKVVNENAHTESGAEIKRAALQYQIKKEVKVNDKKFFIADIKLITGRRHQIRVQFAHHKAPLYGDIKYGNDDEAKESTGEKKGVALCSYAISFKHPANGKQMEYKVKPDNSIFGEIEYDY